MSEEDPDDACTTEVMVRAQSSASPALREVVLLTIARGSSGSESTHLLLHVEGGWWLGPQLADGPFNGNQTSGTLAFRVSEVALQSVFPGEGLALVAHYETETSDEIDGNVRESGLLFCIGLASTQLRCARAPESIHHERLGRVIEARARFQIVGDGTIAVDEVTGSHDRVRRETFYLESLFQ